MNLLAGRLGSLVLLPAVLATSSPLAQTAAKRFALESTDGLRLHNVAAAPATLDGKKGVRITIAEETRQRLPTMTLEQRQQIHPLAVIEGVELANGVIEAEIAGVPAPGAAEGARGFVGIAFRLQNDLKTYDAFYLRPTNGRADDQERRNHAAQYISHPDWPWFRLRSETPSKYEGYVDLVAGAWTAIKIDVRDDHARLFVHHQKQPTLVVNDVKTGPQGKGGVALWIEPETVGHFRNVSVQAR
jgi:hypothetical protein